MTPRGNESRPQPQPQSNSGQLDAINTKLDKILNLLSNTKAVKAQGVEQSQSELPKTNFASAVTAENIEQSLNKTKAEAAKVSKPKKAVKKVHVEIPVELPTETPAE